MKAARLDWLMAEMRQMDSPTASYHFKPSDMRYVSYDLNVTKNTRIWLTSDVGMVEIEGL